MATNGLWTACPEPRPRAAVRLFCFPFAGGGVPVYARWPSGLPEEVELQIIQLPGRGARLGEPPITEFSQLIRTIANAISTDLRRPFAFFGHSLGALVSFELARAIRREFGYQPLCLFLSACAAPNLAFQGSPIHNLPEPEFIAALKRYNGLPVEVLRHEELLSVLMPALRGDFALFENYQYCDDAPLSCPIFAFGGRRDDTVSRESMAAWSQFTDGVFSLRLFPGDHFYINSERQMLLAVLERELEALLETL